MRTRLTLAVVLITGCTCTADSAPVPAAFDGYTNAVTLSATTTSVTLSSSGVPDHKTPYWGAGNAMYEEQLSGRTLAPGVIGEQDFVMTIPVDPQPATSREETSLGPIGMAKNGVAIFNDREGGNLPIDRQVLSSMDTDGAHVGPGGVYHYHFEPSHFTVDDDAALIGHLRDGYPVYARRDMDGSVASDLDSDGGHTGVTRDYPNGTYHYHCSNVNYLDGGTYVIKSGSYHGTKGTFTF